jgi:hypothetical protein
MVTFRRARKALGVTAFAVSLPLAPNAFADAAHDAQSAKDATDMQAPTAPANTPQAAATARPADGAAPNDTPEPANAAQSTAAPIVGPRLHHAPVAVAKVHQPLVVRASIDHPELVRRAVLVYRSLSPSAPSEFREVDFLRGSGGPYVAVIPEEAVNSPGLEYAIELELPAGARQTVFATRSDPQRVAVSEDSMDVRERAALARLGGRRSVASAFFEYVDFGKSAVSSGDGNVSDWYYRVEASYTYRPLRIVDEFSVHVGVVRGVSPLLQPGTNDRTVGLNYAAPSIRFRLGDLARVEGEFLSSVTEVGFSVGGGAALDVGDPYGSKLRVGFESIQVFGTRFWTQVDIQATPRLRLSPVVEATDMPHAGRYGVRLIGEVAYDFGRGFSGAVRGGYQARDATSGGPGAGVRMSWAF